MTSTELVESDNDENNDMFKDLDQECNDNMVDDLNDTSTEVHPSQQKCL